MDDLDPQVIAAVERAAREASDPQLRDRLSAAAAIFAALARRDKREREAWAIVRDVARAEPYYCEQPLGWECTMCEGWQPGTFGHDAKTFEHVPDCPVARARALLEGASRE